MMQSVVQGIGADETELVKNPLIPVALILGSDDASIKQDYLRQLTYGNLWRNQIQAIPNAQHAVFWETPLVFNTVLGQFLSDIFSK